MQTTTTYTVIDRRDGHPIDRYSNRADAEKRADDLNRAHPAKPYRVTMDEFPRLPELPGRHQDETAEQYGLRAFAFVLATGITATVDDDALALATHVYRIAIARADLMQTTIDRFADVDRAINATLRRRAAARDLETPIDAPCSQPAGIDKPNLGPMARLAPRPQTEPPAPALAGLTRADFNF